MEGKKEAKISIRDAFGGALLEAGEKYGNLVVIDCDLGSATRTKAFEKAFPQRFIRAGIAEQHGVSLAAGLSRGGMRPLISSFGSFLTDRALDQIRNSVAYSNNSVILVGSHSGLAIGKDGATQMGIADINNMYGIPGMNIFSPSDAIETGQVVQYIFEQVRGPVYLRTSRNPQEQVHDKDYVFNPEKPEVLRHGSDLALVATGDMVLQGLKASEELSREGISTRVINVSVLNPLHEEGILDSVRDVGAVMTLEDHLADCGFGLRISGIIARKGLGIPVMNHGIQGFGESGDPKDLYKKHGLDSQGIAEKARAFYRAIS